MSNSPLPIPDFFDPHKVGTVWRIPYEERAVQAHDRDRVDRVVDLALAARVESVTDGLAR